MTEVRIGEASFSQPQLCAPLQVSCVRLVICSRRGGVGLRPGAPRIVRRRRVSCPRQQLYLPARAASATGHAPAGDGPRVADVRT